MGCGCHADNRVDSLAVQKQKFLILEQWDIWVEKNSGERKKFEYQKMNVGFHWWSWDKDYSRNLKMLRK